jgi:cytochrome c biogenesis protein ResB
MPGGYILGSAFLVNLAAAHFARFKPDWKKSGIVLVHAGIVLILLGELFTGLMARESQMTLTEGQTSNYSEDPLGVELALVDRNQSGREKHVVIAGEALKGGAMFAPPELPFRVEIVEYHPNAMLGMAQEKMPEGYRSVPADQGVGMRLVFAPADRAKRMNEVDSPLVIFRLHEGQRVIGTWAASPRLGMDQRVAATDGRKWDLGLRQARDYKPFSLTLRDFQHTKYPGTEIPKDFSSFVTMTEKGLEQGRDFRIWMNHPLRHGGYTFYQHQFKGTSKAEDTTVLLVVRNAGWLIPYIACIIVFLGLALQFGLSLHTHLGKRKSHAA